MMDAVPETEAHSPLLLRKEMLMWGSDDRSSVLPLSVLVWKRRSIPPVSLLRDVSDSVSGLECGRSDMR